MLHALLYSALDLAREALLSTAFVISAGTPHLSGNPIVQPDSGFDVRSQGGWRSSSLTVGPYKATGVRTSNRKEVRQGSLLLGAVRERWQVRFDLPDSADGPALRTDCQLDLLKAPAKSATRRLEDQRLFGMDCGVQGDESWTLSVNAGVPGPEVTNTDAAEGLPIGTLTLYNVEWAIVGMGAKRVLPFLWSHPPRFELRNPDGQVDAVVFVDPRRRVWLRPDLADYNRAALLRAAVAILLAEPLADDDADIEPGA